MAHSATACSVVLSCVRMCACGHACMHVCARVPGWECDRFLDHGRVLWVGRRGGGGLRERQRRDRRRKRATGWMVRHHEPDEVAPEHLVKVALAREVEPGQPSVLSRHWVQYLPRM